MYNVLLCSILIYCVLSLAHLNRLIGLEPLVTSKCADDIRIIVYNTEYKADSFLNPIVLFFTFYALALTTKNLIKIRVSFINSLYIST